MIPRTPDDNEVARMVNEVVKYLWLRYKDTDWEKQSPEIWEFIFKDIRHLANKYKVFQTKDGKVYVSSLLKMFLRILDERDKEAQRKRILREEWMKREEDKMIAAEMHQEYDRARDTRDAVDAMRAELENEEPQIKNLKPKNENDDD